MYAVILAATIGQTCNGNRTGNFYYQGGYSFGSQFGQQGPTSFYNYPPQAFAFQGNGNGYQMNEYQRSWHPANYGMQGQFGVYNNGRPIIQIIRYRPGPVISPAGYFCPSCP